MKPSPLTLKERPLVCRFLGYAGHWLSAYSFENIYVWKPLYGIYWRIVDDHLLIFFRDRLGCFLYLPPLGESFSAIAVAESFKAMEGLNPCRQAWRIENIEEKELPFYAGLGYNCLPKEGEYLCRRQALVALSGDKFKSKRSCVNYFRKHYDFQYRDLQPEDRRDILGLYRLWSEERKRKVSGGLYRGMLEDSGRVLQALLDNWGSFRVSGKIVKVGGRVSGFTCGFPVNPQAFCVFYEITDLKVKGLAQFIFREFCRSLEGYRYINIMDESGLDNLRRAKLSYHPEKKIAAYIATRKDA